MEEVLKNLRSRSNGTQHSIVKLLTAIDEVLLHQSTDPSQSPPPSSYLLAILATLESKPEISIINDTISLLSMILPFVSNQFINLNHLKLFQSLSSLNPSQPTKHLIIILNHLFNSSLPFHTLHHPLAHQLFRQVLLPLASLTSQPKLRRQAHLALSSLSLQHPYAPQTSQYLLSQLSQPNLDSQAALSLLALSLEAQHLFVPQDLLNALLGLLQQPQLKSHPFVNERIFDLLDALVGSIPDPQSLLLLLVDSPPSDSRVLVGWLATLEHAWVAWSKKEPQSLQSALGDRDRLPRLVQLLGHQSAPVRNAARNCAEAICRLCFTDEAIQLTLEAHQSQPDHLIQTSPTALQQLINGLDQVLVNLQAWSSPTDELGAVLEALIGRLRDRRNDIPAATPLLQRFIKPLAQHRDRHGIEAVLGKFSSVCGPELLLQHLPLDLSNEDPSESHTWLIPLLSRPGYVINTDLKHFIDHWIPLSESLFERRRNALQRNESGGALEAKACETLVGQIWALLPGYCDLPRDLSSAFTKPFAELLSQVLYTQATLRSPILRGLRNLVDRNLALAKPLPEEADSQLVRNFGISSTLAEENVKRLSSMGSNMSKVMFNVLSRMERKDPARALLVESLTSWIGILSDLDFSQIWSMISTALTRSADQHGESKGASKLPSTLEIMLDIYTILFPRLPAPLAIEGLEMITHERFLAGPAQKKCYRLLATAVETKAYLTPEKVEALLARVMDIGQDPKRVMGGAKPDRASLLAALVGKIGSKRLHLMASVLPEVVLGCKESNQETRETSYDLLIRMGRRMMKDKEGIIDRKLLGGKGGEDQEDDEVLQDEVVPASIDEFVSMVSAGLAGGSPHMVSATIMALSRVLFEFHKELKEDSITGLLSIILVFLDSSKNREIIKSVVGLMKVSIVCLSKEIIEQNLQSIVRGLMIWADEHRNELKRNVRHLLERLVRKFGDGRIGDCLDESDEGGRKLVNSIRKVQNREKKRKLKEKVDGSQLAEVEMGEGGEVGLKRTLNDAYEQALYGSGSEGSDDEEGSKRKPMNRGREFIDEGEEEVVDLLDPTRITKRAIAGKLAKVEQRRTALAAHAASYKKDATTGKMMIEEEEEKEKEEPILGTNAYLEAIEGDEQEGQRRDERGRIKFKKPNGKRAREVLEEETLREMELGVEGLEMVEGGIKKGREEGLEKNKKKMKKERLGAEFKAKKAGGDIVKEKGVSPFAYLPLGDVSGKKQKNRPGGKALDITGKKRGSSSRGGGGGRK